MHHSSRRGQALLLLLLAATTAAAARELRQEGDAAPQEAPQQVDVQWADPGYSPGSWDGSAGGWDGLAGGGWDPLLPEQLAPAAAEAPSLAVAEVAEVSAWSKPAACDELSEEEFWAAFAALGEACPDAEPYSCPDDCLPAMQAVSAPRRGGTPPGKCACTLYWPA